MPNPSKIVRPTSKVPTSIDKRFGDLMSTIDARFAQIDARFAQIDARFADLTSSMTARFAEHGARLLALEGKVDGLQWRLTSLILITWMTTILATLLKH